MRGNSGERSCFSLAGDIHQAGSPEGFLYTPESGDLATSGKGHPVAGLPGALRQNVLPLRGEGVHQAGSREEIVSW